MAASRSNRRRFDDANWQPEPAPRRASTPRPAAATDPDVGPHWSTYRQATRGPVPVPDWVVTDPHATDTDLGVVKSGKEADLSLLRRTALASGQECLLAVKQYRSAEHRLFHRDAGYLEGRRVRKSREMRAMRTRTEFGKLLIADRWAAAEFAMLGELWSLGAPVPYPVQLLGTELMMEFVGTVDAVAAPRLAETRPDPAVARGWYEQLVEALVVMARHGVTHGDLSAYNVLIDRDRVILIDLPQVVDVVGNPQGFDYLRRDCDNITTWFRARGVAADADALASTLAAEIGR